MVICAEEKNKTWKGLGDCLGYGVVAVLSKLTNGGYFVELLYVYIITLFTDFELCLLFDAFISF